MTPRCSAGAALEIATLPGITKLERRSDPLDVSLTSDTG